MKSILVESSIEIIENNLRIKFKIDETIPNIYELRLIIGKKKFSLLEISDDVIIFEIKDYLNEIENIHSKLTLSNKYEKYNINEKKYLNCDYGNLIEKILINKNYVGIRTQANGKYIVLSIVPFYEGGESDKIKYFEKSLKNVEDSEKKYILFFEKRSETYGESSYQVFTKYSKKNENARYILSKGNPDFKKLKEIYKEKIVEKGSFEFYEILVKTKLLVSSELPANLLSGKSIDMNVIRYINKIPFIFLQHGIMFGKPVVSPNARMFWRKNITCNLVKMVVSSEAEMEQLYQVGYTPNELILTGLATLDQVDKTQEKKYCGYMPTYRAWEDMNIYQGNVKKTTYYMDILNVINVFKKLNKLDDLIIIPHPGYEGHINYEQLFPGVKFNNYTNTRDQLKLYITDFSSASFDAQFRGAAIIYYWNRRRELEEHYLAKAPLNGSNTNGIPVENELELYIQIDKLYKTDFEMDQYYIDNFKEKMTFSDFKNTDRIISEIDDYLDEKESNNMKSFKYEDKPIYDFDIASSPMENKILNFIKYKDNIQELKITKLLLAKLEENSLEIKLNKTNKSDYYLHILGKKTNRFIKVKNRENIIKIDTDKFSNIVDYTSLYVIEVPEFAKPCKYLVKAELDYRSEKIISLKKFGAIKRKNPYTEYKFINDEESDGFVRLYKHDNSYEIFKIKKNMSLDIVTPNKMYSHYLKSSNIRIAQCDILI